MAEAEMVEPRTVRERMLAAGIGAERVDAHLAAGVVRVAGEPVTDPGHPAPWPTSIVVGRSS